MIRIERRVSQLERSASANGRLIVAIGPDRMSVPAELQARGLVEGRQDQVIVVRKPAPSTILVKVDGVEI